MALLLLLQLLLLPALFLPCLPTAVLVKPPCPAQLPCQCTDLRIKCVQQDRPQLNYISRVPYFTPSNYETRWSYSYHEMRIRDQALTNLSLQFAWGVLNLNRVEVTSSLVRRLLPNAFKGIIGVQSLNLSHNLLSSLSPADLADLPLLRELILHGNQIRIVHPGAFHRTPFIARLYLSHNRLSEIPPHIRQLSGLTHLYLQFNNISAVRDYAFAGLRKLITLDLGALRRNLHIEHAAFCGLNNEDDATNDVAQSSALGSDNADSANDELPASVSFLLRERGLVALYLRHNIMQELNLCALGKISSLRALNLSGSIFPCTCQAASLANQTLWQAAYGFSPRFVDYESWQLANCEPGEQCQAALRQPDRRRGLCPAVRCQRQPAYQWRPETDGGQDRGVIADWQYSDARLSVRDSWAAGRSNSASRSLSSMQLLLWPWCICLLYSSRSSIIQLIAALKIL